MPAENRQVTMGKALASNRGARNGAMSFLSPVSSNDKEEAAMRKGMFRWAVGAVVCVGVASHAAAQVPCVGDCDVDFAVSVNELVSMVGIALDPNTIDACRLGDRDASGVITIDEIVAGVRAALEGCSPTHADLVTEFSNSVPWCTKQRQCSVLAEGCEGGWASRGTVAAAIAQLSDVAILGCLRAAQAEDACVFPLSCDQFTNYAAFWGCSPGMTTDCCIDGHGEPIACPATHPCAAQHAAFVNSCATLNAILARSANVAGQWSGEWTSSGAGHGSIFTDAHFEQVGPAAYGTIAITGSACLSMAVISARVEGSQITGTVRGEDGYAIEFEGEISLDTIHGTYHDDNPGCGPDDGTFEITRAFSGMEGDSHCEHCRREFTYDASGQQISGPEHCRRISCAEALCTCPDEPSPSCVHILDAGFPSRETAEECDRCSGTLPAHAGDCNVVSTPPHATDGRAGRRAPLKRGRYVHG